MFAKPPIDSAAIGERKPRSPISNEKIRKILGFREQHNWRDEVAKTV